MLILKKLLVVYVKSNLTRHFVFLFAKSGVPKLRFLGSFMPRTIRLNREPTQAPEDGAERGGKEQNPRPTPPALTDTHATDGRERLPRARVPAA